MTDPREAMRVRRKSEIAEAEFDAKWGAWIITHPDGDKQLMLEKEFAAHYEPVPEPPARFECDCESEICICRRLASVSKDMPACKCSCNPYCGCSCHAAPSVYRGAARAEHDPKLALRR